MDANYGCPSAWFTRSRGVSPLIALISDVRQQVMWDVTLAPSIPSRHIAFRETSLILAMPSDSTTRPAATNASAHRGKETPRLCSVSLRRIYAAGFPGNENRRSYE